MVFIKHERHLVSAAYNHMFSALSSYERTQFIDYDNILPSFFTDALYPFSILRQVSSYEQLDRLVRLYRAQTHASSLGISNCTPFADACLKDGAFGRACNNGDLRVFLDSETTTNAYLYSAYDPIVAKFLLFQMQHDVTLRQSVKKASKIFFGVRDL